MLIYDEVGEEILNESDIMETGDEIVEVKEFELTDRQPKEDSSNLIKISSKCLKNKPPSYYN